MALLFALTERRASARCAGGFGLWTLTDAWRRSPHT